MPYFTTCYLNNVTMILSAAWEIPNLFPQSEPAQISSINLSCPTVWKTSNNHCIFWVTVVLWFCIVCSCFNVLTSHVQSSIELLYPINHYCWVGTFLVRNVQSGIARLSAIRPLAMLQTTYVFQILIYFYKTDTTQIFSMIKILPFIKHKIYSKNQSVSTQHRIYKN